MLKYIDIYRENAISFQHMESLRERRLAFRRRNTMKNGKSIYNSSPEFVLPTHPVRFQDR